MKNLFFMERFSWKTAFTRSMAVVPANLVAPYSFIINTISDYIFTTQSVFTRLFIITTPIVYLIVYTRTTTQESLIQEN